MANNLFQDIQCNSDNADLYFNTFDGDFDIMGSDQQHIEDILQSFNGDWKQFPMVGVGISSYLNSVGQEQRLPREVIVQLRADGYTCDNPIIQINQGNIVINPNAYRQ